MTATLPALAQDEGPENGATATAPMLPVEGYLVAATRALERVKADADLALVLLQFNPRDARTAFSTLTGLQERAAEAMDAYRAYFEVMTCRGQA